MHEFTEAEKEKIEEIRKLYNAVYKGTSKMSQIDLGFYIHNNNLYGHVLERAIELHYQDTGRAYLLKKKQPNKNDVETTGKNDAPKLMTGRSEGLDDLAADKHEF